MKQRLDTLMVERGLTLSRERAQALILAGKVRLGDQPALKAGQQVENDVQIVLLEQDHPFVGRGGLKLARALEKFSINVQNKICLDSGASTGGFTDCLLQNGARHVYAVDVGYGQLAWSIRQDERVTVMERTNLRNLTKKDLTNDITLVVLDLSFIALVKVLPTVEKLITKPADIITLIKPQFELTREQVGKGGIVRDENARVEAVTNVLTAASNLNWEHKETIQSPITGADGNVEYLAHFVSN